MSLADLVVYIFKTWGIKANPVYNPKAHSQGKLD